MSEAERRRRKVTVLDMMEYEGMDNLQRSKVFRKMLEENGITAESRWLETMKKCAADPRYKVLEKYGLRYNAFVIYIAQVSVRIHRAQAMTRISCSSDRTKLPLEEHFLQSL